MPGLEKSFPRRGRSSCREPSMSTERKRPSSSKSGSLMPQNLDSQHEKSKSQSQVPSLEDFQEEIGDKEMAPQRQQIQRSPIQHDKWHCNHNSNHSSSKEDVH